MPSALADPPGPAQAGAWPVVVLLRRADELGLARHNLLTLRWERLSRGLYGPCVPERTPIELARALVGVLPRDSAFGHLFSARLRGWWMPNRLGPHVALATTTSDVHVQRQGMYVRRSRYGEFEAIDGVRVSTAPQTLVELARDLAVVDLVPMVDRALREGASPSAIQAAARPRMPGARRLRRALALADPRSESWWETILRLLHVLPGLGPVECQAALNDDDGVSFGRADLHLVGTRRFAECDGGRHRERKRHASDLRREKRICRAEYERYGYTTSEIANSPGMVIRDAEDARGWPHDPARLATWWTWARTSTLTPYGRTLLAARLERYRLAARR
jgi:hypothetical protein